MHEEEKKQKEDHPTWPVKDAKNKGTYVACLLPYPSRKGLENKMKLSWRCKTQWEGELQMKLMQITKFQG